MIGRGIVGSDGALPLPVLHGERVGVRGSRTGSVSCEICIPLNLIDILECQLIGGDELDSMRHWVWLPLTPALSP